MLRVLALLFLANLPRSGNSWTLANEECRATVNAGTVLGQLYFSLDPSKSLCVYGSIPYASPPIGNLRFKAPEPPAPWDSFNATALPSWCPQPGVSTPGVDISEDCLYLSVYQPKYLNASNTRDNLAVMVWLHGGSFATGGSQMYIPTKLMEHGNVIIVVVQYRLGMLGFLSTNDAESPGNFGLKDQAYAIQWVSNNIVAFGGDPNKITIFGESAGGSAVLYQLISPLNKGLLNGAIAQSGTALATWAIDRDPLSSAKTIAERLGCSTLSTEIIIKCMRSLPFERIIEEQNRYSEQLAASLHFKFAGPPGTTPVIEPNLPGAFLTEEPEHVMRHGDVPQIPVMLGATKHDGSYLLGRMYLGALGPLGLTQDAIYLKQSIVEDILKVFEVHGDQFNSGLKASVEMTYLSGVNRSNWTEMMPGLVDLVSVLAFKASIQKTADILSQRNPNVYLYSFEHHSDNSLWTMFFGSADIPIEHGISHADDLMYLFEFGAIFSEADQRMSEVLCDLWIRFAENGSPDLTRENKLVDTWPPYNTVSEPFMKLNITPTMQYGYRASWRPNGFEWN